MESFSKTVALKTPWTKRGEVKVAASLSCAELPGFSGETELRLIYNKARQAAITQEISEIVAGAAAV